MLTGAVAFHDSRAKKKLQWRVALSYLWPHILLPHDWPIHQESYDSRAPLNDPKTKIAKNVSVFHGQFRMRSRQHSSTSYKSCGDRIFSCEGHTISNWMPNINDAVQSISSEKRVVLWNSIRTSASNENPTQPDSIRPISSTNADLSDIGQGFCRVSATRTVFINRVFFCFKTRLYT